LAKVKNTFWNGYALGLWLVLAAWLPPVVGHSQQLCGFDHQLTLWLQNDVNRQEWERTEKAIFERYEQGRGLGKRGQFTIPVVVHIVHPPGLPEGSRFNPSDQEVNKVLNDLNNLFQNEGEYKTSLGVNTGIQFCLAMTAPDLSVTKGILRHATHLVSDPICQNLPSFNINNDTSLKALGSWDCCQYLNLYLVPNIYNPASGCGIVGYASFPGRNCRSTDGIVIESNDWGSAFTTKVLAHEAGHYLGLYHTFHGGCPNNDCRQQGDRVCDTPPDNNRHGPCTFNSCQTDADAQVDNPFTMDMPDATDNLMDYSACFNRFTRGQADRMLSVLENERACITQSNACRPILPYDLLVLEYNTLITCEPEFCLGLHVKNTGLDTIRNFVVQLKVSNQEYNFVIQALIPHGKDTVIHIPCVPVNEGNLDIIVDIPNINQVNVELPNPLNRIEIPIIVPPVSSSNKPEFNIQEAQCGGNGRISPGQNTPPDTYQYELTGPGGYSATNRSGEFTELSPGAYTLRSKHLFFECSYTQSIQIDNNCPPCLSGILNHYYEVTSINCHRDTISIAQAGSELHPGARILIIQMKGASINQTGIDNFGTITDIGNAGNYELATVRLVQQNKIILSKRLERSYDVNGIVQMVHIPLYDDVVLCNVTCQTWNGKTGGIVAIEANGKITLAGNIDVSGKGFSPGKKSQNYYSGACVYPALKHGSRNYGQKGEGISNDLLSENYGRGRVANGGGGGNPVNTGGGGGGLFGKGGQGGNQWAGCVTAPTHFGQGGISLLSFIERDRIFLGGGGGGGQQNDQLGTDGAAGGGAIIIKANELQCGQSFLKADGASAQSINATRTYDGQGAGGSGGFIAVNVNNTASRISATSNGGNGADVRENRNNMEHGGGGGGGGGVLAAKGVSGSNINFTANGGRAGINFFTNNYWGASHGDNGGILQEFTLFEAVDLSSSWTLDTLSDCQTGNLLRICHPLASQIGTTPSNLQQGNCIVVNDISPVNIIAVTSEGCSIDTLVDIPDYAPLEISLQLVQHPTCKPNGLIVVGAGGGKPPYKYYINGIPQDQGGFDGLSPGIYHIKIRDEFGCEKDLEIELKEEPPIVPEYDLSMECLSSMATLDVNILSSGFYTIRLSGNQVDTTTSGRFEWLQPGLYLLRIYDEAGCEVVADSIEIPDFPDDGLVTRLEFKLCPGDFVVSILGDTLRTEGTFFRRIPSGIQPCDSLFIYTLTFLPTNYTTDTLVLCYGDSIHFYGQEIKQAGTYSYQFKNQYGCDSTFSLTVLIKDRTVTNTIHAICSNQTFSFNGELLSTPGEYTALLSTSEGCDSLVTLQLIVYDTTSQVIEIRICPDQNVRIGDYFFNDPGNYIITLKNQNQCDSTIYLQLVPGENSECLPCKIFIPDAFTPNGDGINDMFFPIPFNATILDLRIYSRWGELIFYEQSNTPGWSGFSRNKKWQNGVYIYVVNYICEDGTRKQVQGELTLIH
jgi:gliding motility-associated-like protein